MVVFLALVAALVSGSADYLGGRASSTHSALHVGFVSQATNLLTLPLFALLIGWHRLHHGDVVLGLAGGVCGGAAYVVFFRALAAGRMSVVAPLAALTTALVPVTADLLAGVSLPGGRWAGVALALVAIPALAFRRDEGVGSMTLRGEVASALVAGAGFAGFFMAIGHTSTDSGQWPVVFAAAGGTVTVGLACASQGVVVRRRPPRLAVISGVCMAASGLAINHALQVGPIAVATVLGSLYPLATTALANRFDHEPIGRINLLGVALAVAGASLIAVYR
ncbi:MAG: DMT family transporter [Ilumatobacteraceae bacterium]